MSANWAFHLLNFILAALMYTLLGRFILSFVFAPDSTNYIFRAFVRLTDPVVRVVRAVTPRIVPELVLILFAFIWLLIVRVALLALYAASGTLPTVGGAS